MEDVATVVVCRDSTGELIPLASGTPQFSDAPTGMFIEQVR